MKRQDPADPREASHPKH